MGVFTTKRQLDHASSYADEIAYNIIDHFTSEGFSVTKKQLLSGSWYISISKGNLFKAVLGMKTALNITITKTDQDLEIEATVGIFGQQAIPTAISMLLFWPILVTQIWGMVQQAKLDDRVMSIAESTISHQMTPSLEYDPQHPQHFCHNCGAKTSSTMNFCSACGAKL